MNKKEAKDLIEYALKVSSADQTEVIIYECESSLTRFANNYIHQNVSESNTILSVRTVFGKKIGSASTNSLLLKKIKETVKWAEAIAKFQKENPDFNSLIKVNPKEYKKCPSYLKAIGLFTPQQRAQAVSSIVEVAKKYELTTFGSVSNGWGRIAIGNSLGTFAYQEMNDIFCNIVMCGSDSTGYVQFGTKDLEEMDFVALAEVAAKKAKESSNPIDLPPGRYTTIFEPLAVKNFLEYLAYYAFNGKIFEEGRSYLNGKLGTKVVDERITIIDDPFNTRGFPLLFDFEGFPKRRLVLIDKGIAKNVVYDSLIAGRAKKKNTGHALAFPNPFGPIPLHLSMKGGDVDIKEMIKNTKKGILVTRLHYTNVIDPYKISFTGMTRDGTFLIEDGVIKKGIKNLRFTENLIEALNRVEAISKKPRLVADEPGYEGRFPHGTIVPGLKINDFTFTSVTEF